MRTSLPPARCNLSRPWSSDVFNSSVWLLKLFSCAMFGAANPLNALLFSNIIILPHHASSGVAHLVPKYYFLEGCGSPPYDAYSLRHWSMSVRRFRSPLGRSSLFFARSSRSTKSIPPARGADRSSVRSWRNSKSTISLGPTAMASLRYDNPAETRGDNYGNPRQG